MAIGNINVGQELLNVPMGKMISEMAKAIAEGQWQLDKASMVVSELMSGQRILRNLDTGDLENPNPDGSPRIVDSRVYFGYTYESDGAGGFKRVPQKVAMMELGFTPTFYQFVDTIIEVKISIKITGETDQVNSSSYNDQSTVNANSGSWNWWWGWGGIGYAASNRHTVTTTQVDASYANKYSYSVEGASLLRTKLVPIPPPAVLDDRIREVMRQEQIFNQIQLLKSQLNAATDPAVKAALTQQITAATQNLGPAKAPTA